MKKLKGLKNAHTSNAKIGMGDSFGSGVKNPTGKAKSIMGVSSLKSKRISKPPKSLA